MTHIGPPNQACYSRKFVRQFLCVNFAYANSYVRNAIHKTLLRTKNRKFVLKYAHDLSCRTTENFRKDSELMNLPCGCQHLEKCKIEISWQRFDQSPRNLAWWRNSTLVMLPTLCFVTKLYYVRKIVNSCLNMHTIWAVERQKIFVKIASWWIYLDDWF